MNQRTAKLLRKVSIQQKLNLRTMKRGWNRMDAGGRTFWRKTMKQSLEQ